MNFSKMHEHLRTVLLRKIQRGELTTATDVNQLVEMLVAVMWGMGFYAGYVGSHKQLEAIVEKLELLLANKLWKLAE